MTTPTDDGGAAFPQANPVMNMDPATGIAQYSDSGMSIRDYFAAAALTGALAFPIPGSEKIPDRCARECYAYADAMLSARKRETAS